MERRTFLKCLGCGAAAAVLPGAGLFPDALQMTGCAYAAAGTSLSAHEATYYKRLEDGSIECEQCPRRCRVSRGDRGHCGVRENRDGRYVLLTYGYPCAVNVDPIEKKPFFHFHPGTMALSLATAGCNVDCQFCQNWEISQARPEETPNIELSPSDVVNLAVEKRIPTIAYTYSEPTVWYDFMFDIARLGKEKSISSVVISNGFIERQPLADLLPHVSAYKIDLKSIREDYYRDVVGGRLGPVLERMVQVRASGVLLEVVNLVVPTLNDREDDFRDLARWVKTNLGVDVPVHYSRFYPKYQLKNLPPTPPSTLQRAYDISRAEGLEYVYLGNLPEHPSESTFCPACGELLIGRQGLSVLQNRLVGGRCPKCSHVVPGIF